MDYTGIIRKFKIRHVLKWNLENFTSGFVQQSRVNTHNLSDRTNVHYEVQFVGVGTCPQDSSNPY